MRTNMRGVPSVGWRALAVAAFAVAWVLPCSARPVEYVKVCDLFGAGFNYLPGTDVCVNSANNQAKQATAGGVWQWRMPSNPVEWAPAPQAACEGGSVVKLGKFTISDLTLNAQSRYQTDLLPLRLRPGQYIAKVLYQGGFTNTQDKNGGRGNFCMYYSWQDPTAGTQYSPLGCVDTAPRASLPETLSFVPDQPVPPATSSEVHLVGANGDLWDTLPNANISGELSVWLCLGRSGKSHDDDSDSR